jgi:predicted ATP-dependent endonuclease of OLD family
MRIEFIEIQNFRKLESIRIDLDEETTLLVGANNSGKTSAMVALGHFLVDQGRFTTNDFTLSKWATINKIAAEWQRGSADQDTALSAWDGVLPVLDVWLSVGADELHRVRDLVPTLDWNGGLLGVRLRFEPKGVDDLRKQYLAATTAANETKKAGAEKGANGHEYTVTLWPKDMRSFLDRRLNEVFAVRAYLLDPAKEDPPSRGIARAQPLPSGAEPVEKNPLRELIRIDEIGAQRGLGEHWTDQADAAADNIPSSGAKRRLSEQLRAYYSKHLAPSDFPEPEDLDALQAIENAQKAFDGRLEVGFSAAMKELESLNYPGVTDPKLKIATKMQPTDGLRHSAAVQYQVVTEDGKVITTGLTLPEEYNGLGYQNLIYMVFRLMAFRDAWMRVGKAAKSTSGETIDNSSLPPLHLVLIEEPEAHLHCQVQQVFVRKAYKVLRNHNDLKKKTTLQTQLIVSTHSSHIAHECKFSCLRYFRRLPAESPGAVPTAAVINLSEVFGSGDATTEFVTRYLRTTHCDLFFADAAIFVEGPAERILVPHFILKHVPALNHCYVTLLEIGGSHAHKLRPLVESLGLTTLIITDIDSAESSGHRNVVPPKRGSNQLSRNTTLKDWHPGKQSLDDLLAVTEASKVKKGDVPLFSIRVAYQIPITATVTAQEGPTEALATTFEDSLVFENLALFRKLEGDGMIKKFRDAIEAARSASLLSDAMADILRNGDKAKFALDLLAIPKFTDLVAPRYILNGLEWLEAQLTRKQAGVLATASLADSAGAA